MTETISCKQCGLVNDYKVVENNKHKSAYCNGCNSYIKHLPQGDPALHFGKYKGTLVKDIQDLDYLQWVWDNIRLSANLRKAVDEQMQLLNKSNFLAR